MKKILIVDDEKDVRYYLKLALEDSGFEVSEAPGGKEALEMIKLDPPDLISLDLVMPGFSGARLHRELQKNPQWSKIPILIVTGHAQDELGRADLAELTISGPGIYLEKPVKPAAYLAAVKQLLGIAPDAAGENGVENLRKAVAQNLASADAETLKKALELLKSHN